MGIQGKIETENMKNEDCRMSNFEFLNKDVLTEQYYQKAAEAEMSYAMGLFPTSWFLHEL